jgi:hypothetical protein
LISSGAGKSGNPCERLTASWRCASRVISRITDSVNWAAFFEPRGRSMGYAVGPHFSAAGSGPTEVGPYCNGPWRHVGLYGYRRRFLPAFAALPPSPLEQTERLEQLRALEHGVRIKVLETPHFSIGVDTPADLAKVDALLASRVDADVPMTHGT